MLSVTINRPFRLHFQQAKPNPSNASKQEESPSTILGERYNAAMIYAARLHRYQARKYGNVPYIAHLQSVAALVLRNGGKEDEAIAAWLHDAVEDQGGWNTLNEIRTRFGDHVAELVKGCSDCFTEPTAPLTQRVEDWWKCRRAKQSLLQAGLDFIREFFHGTKRVLLGKGVLFPEQRPPWIERKRAYLKYLHQEAPSSVLLISACDKLDNVRCQLQEYRTYREEHWNNFSAGKDTLQYFDTALKVYKKRGLQAPVIEELEQTLQEFKQLVEKESGQLHFSQNLFDGIES